MFGDDAVIILMVFISHCRFKIEEMPLFVFFTNSLTSPL